MKQPSLSIKTYLRKIRHHLHLPADIRRRVLSDLVSSIESRRESGMSDAQIIAELGTPAAVAEELNQQMADFAYQKSPWRWLFLALAVLCGVILLDSSQLIPSLSCLGNYGTIGGADGPTVIFITQSPESATQTLLMAGLLLVMSLLGFWYLGHMRKSK